MSGTIRTRTPRRPLTPARAVTPARAQVSVDADPDALDPATPGPRSSPAWTGYIVWVITGAALCLAVAGGIYIQNRRQAQRDAQAQTPAASVPATPAPATPVASAPATPVASTPAIQTPAPGTAAPSATETAPRVAAPPVKAPALDAPIPIPPPPAKRTAPAAADPRGPDSAAKDPAPAAKQTADSAAETPAKKSGRVNTLLFPSCGVNSLEQYIRGAQGQSAQAEDVWLLEVESLSWSGKHCAIQFRIIEKYKDSGTKHQTLTIETATPQDDFGFATNAGVGRRFVFFITRQLSDYFVLTEADYRTLGGK